MESTEDTRDRSRPFIVVRHKHEFYYARLSNKEPIQYDIMAKCTEPEAREIVAAANKGSGF